MGSGNGKSAAVCLGRYSLGRGTYGSGRSGNGLLPNCPSLHSLGKAFVDQACDSGGPGAGMLMGSFRSSQSITQSKDNTAKGQTGQELEHC